MKQLVKSTLAVIALATFTSQAVSAQSQTSNVNSRERILQVLDQSRPNEYPKQARTQGRTGPQGLLPCHQHGFRKGVLRDCSTQNRHPVW